MPPICAAIRDVRIEVGLSQGDLGQLLNKRQAHITKWETFREPKLDEISELERVMQVERGYLLRRAGYVKEPKRTEEAIKSDPALSLGYQQIILDSYRSAVRHSREERGSSDRPSPKTPSKRKR